MCVNGQRLWYDVMIGTWCESLECGIEKLPFRFWESDVWLVLKGPTAALLGWNG